MHKRTVTVAGVVAVTVALAVGGVALGLAVSNRSSSAAAPASCSSSAPKLTVQGTGDASATPDLLTVSVDISVTDPTAQASLVDDNKRADAVTAVLEQGGVADKDIQTSNVSIDPDYSSTGAITGYVMTNTLTANLHNFSTAGSVIDALTAAAGNATRLDSLTFSLQDPRAIEDQARTDAVHQAVSHARSMAQAAGERLGPVCSLSDDTPLPVYYGFGNDVAHSSAAVPSASPVPLQAGTQQVTAQVTLVYALEQGRARA